MILSILIDIGLRFCAVPSHLTWITLRSRSRTLKFCVKVLVNVLLSLYLLNMLMDKVDTFQFDRYWSRVLCCTITSHLDDLEIKVTDLKFCVKVLVNVFRS